MNADVSPPPHRDSGCAATGDGLVPAVTRAFVFTDIEGSTAYWERRDAPFVMRSTTTIRSSVR
jgi:class 3 adenylate cyclase